jgi:hypothetical protein
LIEKILKLMDKYEIRISELAAAKIEIDQKVCLVMRRQA